MESALWINYSVLPVHYSTTSHTLSTHKSLEFSEFCPSRAWNSVKSSLGCDAIVVTGQAVRAAAGLPRSGCGQVVVELER